ncbi:DUF7550 family protein [Natronobiforma cellulositropha]|uniref:DUF7550 family protein n=1 Tax=Natronobiforma cellulositropha TaxID=1679076 RepID=UPI0021D5F2E8|nr:hypothetical protein [Natronobiforma cellulositropha]
MADPVDEPEDAHGDEEIDPVHDQDSAATVGHDIDEGRTTAPMSEFTTRAAGLGALVLAVGLVVAFAIPVLATF